MSYQVSPLVDPLSWAIGRYLGNLPAQPDMPVLNTYRYGNQLLDSPRYPRSLLNWLPTNNTWVLKKPQVYKKASELTVGDILTPEVAEAIVSGEHVPEVHVVEEHTSWWSRLFASSPSTQQQQPTDEQLDTKVKEQFAKIPAAVNEERAKLLATPSAEQQLYDLATRIILSDPDALSHDQRMAVQVLDVLAHDTKELRGLDRHAKRVATSVSWANGGFIAVASKLWLSQLLHYVATGTGMPIIETSVYSTLFAHGAALTGGAIVAQRLYEDTEEREWWNDIVFRDSVRKSIKNLTWWDTPVGRLVGNSIEAARASAHSATIAPTATAEAVVPSAIAPVNATAADVEVLVEAVIAVSGSGQVTVPEATLLVTMLSGAPSSLGRPTVIPDVDTERSWSDQLTDWFNLGSARMLGQRREWFQFWGPPGELMHDLLLLADDMVHFRTEFFSDFAAILWKWISWRGAIGVSILASAVIGLKGFIRLVCDFLRYLACRAGAFLKRELDRGLGRNIERERQFQLTQLRIKTEESASIEEVDDATEKHAALIDAFNHKIAMIETNSVIVDKAFAMKVAEGKHALELEAVVKRMRAANEIKEEVQRRKRTGEVIFAIQTDEFNRRAAFLVLLIKHRMHTITPKESTRLGELSMELMLPIDPTEEEIQYDLNHSDDDDARERFDRLAKVLLRFHLQSQLMVRFVNARVQQAADDVQAASTYEYVKDDTAANVLAATRADAEAELRLIFADIARRHSWRSSDKELVLHGAAAAPVSVLREPVMQYHQTLHDRVMQHRPRPGVRRAVTTFFKEKLAHLSSVKELIEIALGRRRQSSVSHPPASALLWMMACTLHARLDDRVIARAIRDAKNAGRVKKKHANDEPPPLEQMAALDLYA